MPSWGNLRDLGFNKIKNKKAAKHEGFENLKTFILTTQQLTISKLFAEWP